MAHKVLVVDRATKVCKVPRVLKALLAHRVLAVLRVLR